MLLTVTVKSLTSEFVGGISSLGEIPLDKCSLETNQGPTIWSKLQIGRCGGFIQNERDP